MTPREGEQRKVGFALGLLFFPYVFAWFTLRQGHSTLTRVASFAWMAVMLFKMLILTVLLLDTDFSAEP